MPENTLFKTLDISLVVPLYNEEESLPELVEWINNVLLENSLSGEIILVDDGSRDSSWDVINSLSEQYPNILGIKFIRNYGKSAALNKGFEHARGKVVITLDADLQDSPDEIPDLYRMIEEGGFDLVSGWKKKRFDPVSKTIPTKIYNWATRKMSGIKLHDFNCGIKAYKNKVVKNIEVYGEMHRYIPVLAKKEGFRKIGEKIVEHRPRKYGTTKFGLNRFIYGFLDLLTVSFVSRFSKKPMHLFGTLGMLMFLLGFLMFAGIAGGKLYSIYHNIPAKNIANMSAFYIALTAMIIGVQLFAAGFLAELLGRNSQDRNLYKVESTISSGDYARTE